MMTAVDWSQPNAFEQWQARCEAARERERVTGISAMDRAIAELQAAAGGSVHACDLARVGFWKTKTGWGLLERLVPGLICPPAGEADAASMEATADHLEEQGGLMSAEARDCRALRLYAAEVRAASERMEAVA